MDDLPLVVKFQRFCRVVELKFRLVSDVWDSRTNDWNIITTRSLLDEEESQLLVILDLLKNRY